MDHWKVGKLNYRKVPVPVDWKRFRIEVEELLQDIGASYYLKKSLTG